MTQTIFKSLMIIAAVMLVLPVGLSAGVGVPIADLAATGQTTSYSTNDDGDLQNGVAWPSPRFVDNLDGTMTDQLTGLMWTKDANLINPNVGTDNYLNLNNYVNNTFNGGGGYAGHTDWRIPNTRELESLLNYGAASTAAWLIGEGFTNVQAAGYWVSTWYSDVNNGGWGINLGNNTTSYWLGRSGSGASTNLFVWTVRGGTNGDAGSYPAEVRKTGQTTAHATFPRDDGALEWGVTAWNAGRFTDNTDGTMTDNQTGRMWTKDGSPLTTAIGIDNMGVRNWEKALDFVDYINTGQSFCSSSIDACSVDGDCPGNGTNGYCTNNPYTRCADDTGCNAGSCATIGNRCENDPSQICTSHADCGTGNPPYCRTGKRCSVTTSTICTNNTHCPSGETCATTSCFTDGGCIDPIVDECRNAEGCVADGGESCVAAPDNLGYTDWRLPNFREVHTSFVHAQTERSDDDIAAYGFTNVGGVPTTQPGRGCGIWTSTTYPGDTLNILTTGFGWGAGQIANHPKIGVGTQFCGVNQQVPYIVWPVRGGTPIPQAINLPQTGQTTAYSPGDDGDIRAGVAWPIGGTSPSGRFDDNGDGTITDLLTGLMWTQNANNGPSTFLNARNAVAALGTGGHDDWRVPNMLELESMTHAGQADSAAWLNTESFTGVQSVEYWVSNVYVNAANGGWVLNLGTDQTNYWLGWNDPGTTRHYWAVRGGANGAPDPTYPANVRKTGQTVSYTAGDDGDFEWGVAPPVPRFTDNSDGTMTDDLTGLMWTQSASPFSTIGAAGTIHSFSDAMGFVDAINAGDKVCRVDPAQRKQCFPWGGRPVIPQTLCPADYVCVGATLNPDAYGECYGPGLTYCNVDGDCNAAENEQCAQLDNHSYTDWRLANKREMYSLIHWDSDLVNPNEDLNEFSTDELAAAGFTVPNFAWCSHWTSTADPADPLNKVFGVSLNTGGSQMLTHPLVTTQGPLGCNWSYVPQFVWPVRGGVVEVRDISVSGSGRNYPIPRRRASLTVNADSADLAGSLVRYYYTHQRLNFVSTSIASVTGGSGTVVITGTGDATKARGADCLACSFTVTIIDGSPDEMAIEIINGGTYYKDPGSGTRAITGGNFTIVE